MFARLPKPSTLTPLLILMGGLLPASAWASPLYSATSLFYYPDWATTACKKDGNIFQEATENWRAGLAAHGVPLSAHDATIFWSELTDVTYGGDDANWGNADTADIAFIATHGVAERISPSGVNCYTTEDSRCTFGSWYALLTTTSGNPSGTCLANTDHMVIGNYNAEYLDTFSCESLEIRGESYEFWVTTQLFASGSLHQWHGFTGTSASGHGTSDMTDDYIDDAFDGSAAVAWVVNLTSWDHWGGPADVCAVSYGRANSSTDLYYREWNERYGVTDYADPTGYIGGYLYYSSCDPNSPIPGTMGTW